MPALGLTLSVLFFLCLAPVPTARAGAGTEAAAMGCGAVANGLLWAATTEVAVDPHSLEFHAVSGEEPPESQFIAVQCYDPSSLYSDCGGSLSSNQDWLLTDRKSFFGVDNVRVSIDPTGLEPGTYEGKIHVSYDLAFDDEDVVVTLEVKPPETEPTQPVPPE